MKKSKMKKSILVGALFLSSLSFGQKKNETSAAVEFLNRYSPAMKAKEYAEAKKSLIAAKEFIDLAAAHPETMQSPKTLYLKSEIYLASVKLAAESGDATVLQAFGETNAVLSQSLEAMKQSFTISKKYHGELTDAAYGAQTSFNDRATVAYKEEKFKEAGELFDWRAKFMGAVGMLDSGAVYFAAVCQEKTGNYQLAADNFYQLAKAGYEGAACYGLAASAYSKAGETAKGKSIIEEGRKLYPNDRDLLMELVNINIEAKDQAGAEKALSDAIAADPKNDQLYYIIGTIYMEMTQNEKAEQNLMKAVELNPNNMDAQYQLGAHLVSWATDLKNEANALKFGDAQYDVLMSKSNDTYKRALPPLEIYIGKNPEDKAVLTILFQLHRALGNSEKAAEYKKRADALK